MSSKGKTKSSIGKKSLILATIISLFVLFCGAFSYAYTVNPNFSTAVINLLASASTAKAGTTNPVAEQVLPSNGDVFRIVPGTKQRVSFVATVKTDSNKPVTANIIYQRVGESQWTSFGTAATTDMYGKSTKPNYKTSPYINATGWNCQMSFSGTTTPPNCNTQITKNGVASVPAFSGEKIYFPAVDLAPGTYRWAVKGKTNDNPYVDWSLQKWFTVKNLSTVYNSVRTDKKMVAITFDDGPHNTLQNPAVL